VEPNNTDIIFMTIKVKINKNNLITVIISKIHFHISMCSIAYSLILNNVKLCIHFLNPRVNKISTIAGIQVRLIDLYFYRCCKKAGLNHLDQLIYHLST